MDITNKCWVWPGSIMPGTGYGQIKINKRAKMAHRVFYEMAYGPIPDGKQIDHLCHTRNCVNPHHLEAVLPRENIIRSNGIASKNIAKSRCKRGHEFSYISKNGQRICRECIMLNTRKYRERNPYNKEQRAKTYDAQKRREYYLRIRKVENPRY